MSEDDPPHPCPLGQGALPRDLVRRLLAEHVPAGTPVIVGHRDLGAQRAWLGLQD
jgi:hypothetical protein